MDVRTLSETGLKQFFDLPNERLRSYFGRVENGQPVEYRTPFYKGRDLQEVLHEWMDHLTPLKTSWPSLYEFEMDLAKKVGPLSVMKPLKERMADIESYYDSILLNRVPIDEAAVTAVFVEWERCIGLRLKSQRRTVEDMKKSTSSGNPFFTRKRRVVDETVPFGLWSLGDNVIQQLPSRSYWSTAILGWRGQEGGPTRNDVKQRVVWMFPFAVNIAELQFYQPFIQSAKKHGLVPAWIGLDAVDKRVTKMFDSKSSKDVVVCTDFTAFDQHFNPVMQEGAYKLFRHIMTYEEQTERWLKQVFPIKYNIPLLISENTIIYGPHGMGSGSGGTNADETVAHRMLQHEAAITAGKSLNMYSQCLGDDGILTYPGIDVEHVVNQYESHGLEMNPSKQHVSTEDCTYLRRWYHKDYRVNGVCAGVYSTCRALGRLAEQERFYDPKVWGPKAVAIRALSILENIKYHPLKELFVEFCIKGDKFRLGLDIPGFFEPENLDRESKRLSKEMPYFIGYTKSLDLDLESSDDTGINTWWIVNYLRNMASPSIVSLIHDPRFL